MHSVLDETFVRWLDLFEKATNCSKSLVLSSVIALASALCGPNTKVTTRDGSFSNSLNTFLIAVCDPGGGKSNTFDRVIQPVLDNTCKRHGLNLQIESYTTAGIQAHQISNKGYGLITGDEGHRFLSSVNIKQNKGEAEKALLCKLWGGKGDTNALANGVRGFNSTSISAAVFIQPEPLLKELKSLIGADGLLDRFLFIAAKPVFNKCAVVKENFALLQQSPMKDFVRVMNCIYVEHKSGKTYTLSDEAQKSYEEMVDAYAEYIRDKYSEEGMYISNVTKINVHHNVILIGKVIQLTCYVNAST